MSLVVHEKLSDRLPSPSSSIKSLVSENSIPDETPGKRSNSSMRRFRNEVNTQSNIFRYVIDSDKTYFDIEAEADREMLRTDDSFKNPYSRQDYFDVVAYKYHQAAMLAEEAGAYEYSALLLIKEYNVVIDKLYPDSSKWFNVIAVLLEGVIPNQLVHPSEKVKILLDGIFSQYAARPCDEIRLYFLKEIASYYQKTDRSDEVKKIVERMLVLYDEKLSELIQDSECDSMDKGKNRLDKASICEEFKIETQLCDELYKEAGDLLRTEEYSYDQDAFFSCRMVAAMCYEKTPQYAHLAQEIYEEELKQCAHYRQKIVKILEGALAKIPTNTTTSDEDCTGSSESDGSFEASYYLFLYLQITKAEKFLALKTGNQELFLSLSEFEIQCMKATIQALGNLSFFFGYVSPNAKGPALYFGYCQFLATYYDDLKLPEKAESIRAQARELAAALQINPDSEFAQYIEQVSKTLTELYHSSDDRSVNAVIDQFANWIS